MEVRHFENLLRWVNLRILNVCNFIISEQKHSKLGSIFLK